MSSRISYKIHSSSNNSSIYPASNILVNSPKNQDSRWAGLAKEVGSNSRPRRPEFVQIELERPAVITAIGFGKYYKTHACNLSDFRVSGGMNADHLQLLCQGSLKNDSKEEKFSLRSAIARFETTMPIKYLRIDAIASSSPNFNVSIWHVFLEGYDEPAQMKDVLKNFELYRNQRTSHLILSHLRRQNLSAFEALRSSLPPSISDSFEHPILTKLYGLVVQNTASTSAAETVIDEALEAGLFSDWGRSGKKGKSRGRWELLHRGVGGPGERSGHHMVLIKNRILLFGGWDGEKAYNDLWEWDLEAESGWKLLQPNQEEKNRPYARSCAQFVAGDEWIYLLGGIPASIDPLESLIQSDSSLISPSVGDDTEMSPAQSPVSSERNDSKPKGKNDFWRYKAFGENAGTWELLSSDTEAVGGPKLIHDHQAVISSVSGQLFVFGGQVYDPSRYGAEYSGFYCFDLLKRTWSLAFDDSIQSNTLPARKESCPKSRVGHSMFLESASLDPKYPQKLYILGGQRFDSYLSDLWSIPIPIGGIIQAGLPRLECADYTVQGGPPASFTQRLMVDSSQIEGGKGLLWTVISGLHKDPSEPNTDKIDTKVWRFRGGKWSNLLDSEMKLGEADADRPSGRWASQVVGPVNGEYFMMGGNSDAAGVGGRLSDFWKLITNDPSPQDGSRRAKFLVRKLKFQERCRISSPLTALNYLQTSLAELVDHSDLESVERLKICLLKLLSSPIQEDDEMEEVDEEVSFQKALSEMNKEESHRERTEIWLELLDLFDSTAVEPREDLQDLLLQ